MILAMVRTYTGPTGCVTMIFKRRLWGPQTVYQTEKPGAPESETQKRGKNSKGVGVGGLVKKGLQQQDRKLSQPVSLPLKHKSVKTEIVSTSPRINREHAWAGRADRHKNCFYKQVLRY